MVVVCRLRLESLAFRFRQFPSGHDLSQDISPR